MPLDPSAARPSSSFSDNPFYQGAWVCYVNGVETPIMGFEVQGGVWQIPSFRIFCVPDITIQRMGHEDRVPVQIFYLDTWGQREPTFRLLVDGEIVGWSFTNATGSRSIAFSCLAHIHLFQQLYFYFITNIDDVVGAQLPDVGAQGFTTAGLIYPYAIFHQGLLSTHTQRDIQSDSSDIQGEATGTADDLIKAPYELVTNVIKGTISQAVPPERRSAPMMNFFARHIRKVRFQNRWVRLPILEDADQLAAMNGVFPIFNAARNDAALNAMQQQIGGQMGTSGPVWNLFQQVLSLVYMEIGSVPNPVCVQVLLDPLVVPGATAPQVQEGKIIKELADDTPLTAIREGVDQSALRTLAEQLATQIRTGLTGGSDAPGAGSGTPAEAVTAIYQGILRQLEATYSGYDENARTGPTGLLGRQWSQVETPDAALPNPTQFAQSLASMISHAAPGAASLITRDLAQITAQYGTRSAADHVTATAQAQFQARAAQTSVTTPPTMTPALQEALTAGGYTSTPALTDVTPDHIFTHLVDQANATSLRSGITDAAYTDPKTPIRLAQHFVKPNFYFAEIPSCNAIFPSMVDMWSYDESYINQPTRIYINDAVMNRALRTQGAQREFMIHALSVAWPEEADALMHHRIGELDAAAGSNGSRGTVESGKNLLIWPEEFYKGPVVARGELPTWFQMLQQMRNAAHPQTGPNAGTGGSGTPTPGTAYTPTLDEERSVYDDILQRFIAAFRANNNTGNLIDPFANVRETYLVPLGDHTTLPNNAVMTPSNFAYYLSNLGQAAGLTGADSLTYERLAPARQAMIATQREAVTKYGSQTASQYLVLRHNISTSRATPSSTTAPTAPTGTTPAQANANTQATAAASAAAAAAEATPPTTAPTGTPTAPGTLPGSVQFAGATANSTDAVRPTSTLPYWAVRVGHDVRINGVVGSANARFTVEANSGLDPTMYRERKWTALWAPDPPRHVQANPQLASNRRTRNRPASQASPRRFNAASYAHLDTVRAQLVGAIWQGDDNDKIESLRSAQMIRLFRPVVQTHMSSLSGDALLTATLGIYWISLMEQGWRGYNTWGFGNGKQYTSSRRAPWTAGYEPYPVPYQAGESAQDGAERFVSDLYLRYARVFPVLLTGQIADAGYREWMRSHPFQNGSWPAPMRPDIMYSFLGWMGYYGTEHSPAPDRAAEGQVKIRRIYNEYRRQKFLSDHSSLIPDDVSETVGVHPRPLGRELCSPVDLAYIQARGARVIAGQHVPVGGGGGNGGSAGATDPAMAASGDTFTELFRYYAQYEYLKQRYSQRNATAQLRFNPYLVAGFPAMIMDPMSTRMHCVGYVQAFSHSGMVSGGGASMSSTVQLSFCRTIHEFIADVRDDAIRYAGRVTSAPAELIQQIRVAVQDESNAEEVYGTLLYGRARGAENHNAAHPAVFRWDRAFAFADGSAVGEEIDILGESVATLGAIGSAGSTTTNAPAPTPPAGTGTPAPATPGTSGATAATSRATAGSTPAAGGVTTPGQTPTTGAQASAEGSVRAGGVSSTGQRTANTNLDPVRELIPNIRNVYGDAFTSYHIAMQMASRPICTLEQFIRFWHGGRTIGDLVASGDVDAPRYDFAYHRVETLDVVGTGSQGQAIQGTGVRPTAAYYGRIYKLRPGPGPQPTIEQRGYTDPPGIMPTPVVAGIPGDYPQTRADWDTVLIAYRNKIRNRISPST